MEDQRILTIRDKVKKEFALAKDDFESSALLYETEKFRQSIPFFINSIERGIISLLMIYYDEIPQDSNSLIDTFCNSELSTKIKLDKDLKKILNELKNLEEELNKHPLNPTKEEIKKLGEFYKRISDFIDQEKKIINSTLRTSKEIKKKKKSRKIAFVLIGILAGLIFIHQIFNFISSLDEGLHGKYYADEHFTQLIGTRRDKNINFDWGLGNIIDGYKDNVYIRWLSKLKIPQSGTYTFIATMDDGLRLWLDEELLINDWNTHLITRRAKIKLNKGIHDIKIGYFEAGGPGCIKLFWIRPGEKKKSIIPPSYFVYKQNKKRALFLSLDASQKITESPVGQIIKGREVGQTFYCEHNNLSFIQVKLGTYRRQNRQDIVFHLKESPTAEEDISTQTFNASEVKDNKYRRFDFSPISDSKGKSYYFSFESPQSKKGDVITVWSSEKDRYKKGSLYINQKKKTGDLTFKTFHYEYEFFSKSQKTKK